MEFHDREELAVDFLCELYAVTGDHLRRHLELMKHVITNGSVSAIIDSTADFLVISQVGDARPKIHDIGLLFRDETFNIDQVAVHKDKLFESNLQTVLEELNALDIFHM